MTVVSDFEDDEGHYEDTLREAGKKAKSPDEKRFVRNMAERFEEYGMGGAYLSEDQHRWLLRLAWG